jgi:hypothetical protein
MVKEAAEKRKRQRKIPDYLVREWIDGKPFYYKGYKEVLNKKKTLEDIMGSSTLQAYIIAFLMEVIIEGKLKKKYEILTNEAGLHLDKRNNLSADILIYNPTVMTPEKINKQYADVPAKVQIEVDITIELEDLKDYQYVEKKINKLHQFGTEKVIWVLTNIKKVMVAVPNQPWQTYDWNNDIELLDDVTFNIGVYLKEKGVTLPE